MKLLHIYIRSYGDIFEDQNFSFSDSYIVKYERNNKELVIHKNKDFHAGFYGKCISDITAIVGKNGVGKTTLLDIIGRSFEDRVEHLNISGDKIMDRYFLIYHVKDNIFFFEGVWDEPLKGMGLENTGLFQAFFFQVDNNICKKLNKSDFRYDDILDEISDCKDRILYMGNKRKDITENIRILCLTGGRKPAFIERISEENGDYGEWYITYLNLFQKRIISSNNMRISFSINPIIRAFYNIFFHINAMPTEKVEKRIDRHAILVDECVEDLYKHVFSCIINYIYVKTQKGDQGLLEDVFQKEYNEKAAEQYYEEIDDDKDNWLRLRDELDILENETDFQDAYKRIWAIIENCFQNGSLKKYIQEVKKLLGSLYNAREFIIPGVDGFKLIMKTDIFEKEVYEFLRMYTELRASIDELNNQVAEGKDYENPLIINGMECSEGEKKMITLLSAIKSYCKIFINMQPLGGQEKVFIILVDEIENDMHLEWSRTLLKHISELLENEYFEFDENVKYAWSELGFRIQLIFTTHSPFILSDLKKTSIIALKKEDGKGKKQNSLHTFAQNIQKIMANEFFIDDCYGALAQSKIQEVIQIITSEAEMSKKDEENIEMILSEIGEPIIRKKLQEMFYKKIGKRKKWIEQLLREEEYS